MFETIQSIDLSILQWMQQNQNPVLMWLAWAVATLAWKGWLWWPVIIGSWFKGNRMFSAQLAAAIGIATVAGLPMKSIIARPRPDLYMSQKYNIPMPELLSTQHSFPSGHTLLAAAFAYVVVSYYRDWRAGLAIIFAVAVGLSRVYQLMHWASDCIGSAILGMIAGWVAGMIVRHPAVRALIEKKAKKKLQAIPAVKIADGVKLSDLVNK